jgi:hypothetical protein
MKLSLKPSDPVWAFFGGGVETPQLPGLNKKTSIFDVYMFGRLKIILKDLMDLAEFFSRTNGVIQFKVLSLEKLFFSAAKELHFSHCRVVIKQRVPDITRKGLQDQDTNTITWFISKVNKLLESRVNKLVGVFEKDSVQFKADRRRQISKLLINPVWGRFERQRTQKSSTSRDKFKSIL